MKIIKCDHKGGHLYYFYCPGCGHAHGYTVECGIPNQNWYFDQSKVSFTPSLRVYVTDPESKKETTLCHLFITDGKILFCGDCPHKLNGQTVALPDFPEGYGFLEPYEVVL